MAARCARRIGGASAAAVWSVPLLESERDARIARLTIFPITHDFRRDRTLLVQIKGKASPDLGRIVVVIAIERIPETVGNEIPGYCLT